MAWLLLACGSPTLAGPTQTVETSAATVQVPADWALVRTGAQLRATEPSTTRCGPATVVLEPYPTAGSDTVERSGMRCETERTVRHLAGTRLTCEASYERDGFGPPTTICAAIVATYAAR